MEFLDGHRAKERIKDLATSAKKGRYAVAFWGDGAAEILGLLKVADQTQVVCNLSTGGTNPEEVIRLIKGGVDVRQSDELHAKVYLFPKAVVVGSSNASANGLSLQGDECSGWSEANVLSDDPAFIKTMKAWFDGIWASARAISDDDLNLARELWTRRRRHLPKPRVMAAEDLLDALSRNPGAFRDRRVYLVVYSSYMDRDGRQAMAYAREELGVGKELGGFQGWSSLPDAADLLTVYFGRRGKVRYEGWWQMPETRQEVPAGDDKVLLCWKRQNLYGCPVGSDDRWRQVLTLLRESDIWDKKDGSACVDLGEFAQRIVVPWLADAV